MLAGIFSQIHQNVDSEVANEAVRERCIKFLATKVKPLGREVINKEAEELIITECKKILEVCKLFVQLTCKCIVFKYVPIYT